MDIEIAKDANGDDVPLTKHWTIFRMPANPNDRCTYKDDCDQVKKYTCMPDQTFKGREVVGCYKPDPTNSNKMKLQADYLSPEAVKCKKLNELCSAQSINGRTACVDAVIAKHWPRLGVAESSFANVNKCPIEYPYGTIADFTCPLP